MPCSTDPVKLPKKGYPLRPCPSAAILAVSTPDKFRTAYVPGKPVRRCFEGPVSSVSGVISGFTDGDYLTVPTANLGMGGDFTVECFAFIPETSYIVVFASRDWGIYINAQYIRWYTDFVLKAPYVGKWTHLAMVRDSGVDYMYVDGVNVGNYAQPIGGTLYIGYGDEDDVPFTNGKISNFRVSNFARYNQNFTPSFPLTADGNTTLLLTDSLTNDVPGGAVVTTVDSVSIAPESISYTPYVSP